MIIPLLLLRVPLLALVVMLVAALPALAHASPPDPSWIPGVYDDADDDDVVVMVTSGTADVPAGPPTDLRPPRTPAEPLAPPFERAPISHHASATRPRAPPAV